MKTLLYPKTYATIIKLDNKNGTIVAKTETCQEYVLELRWRNGKGSTADFIIGSKIKVYSDNKNRLKFRKVGS